MVAMGPRPALGRCGLAETDPTELGEALVRAWDDFLEVVRAPTTDLDRPSRLTGLSGRDVLVHLGEWPDNHVVGAVLSSAAEGGHGTSEPPGDGNAELITAHRDATTEQVVEAVAAARDRLQRFFDGPEAATWGRALARSTVGPLPVLSLLHAATFELAVHALDLAPCGAPPPPGHLLDRGLAALVDITGSLSARADVDLDLTATSPVGGWRFATGPAARGWTTTCVPPGGFEGVGVHGPATDLLDTAAGRTSLPQLLLGRRIHVQELSQWLRLAPLLDDLPGLPGGAALASAAAGLSGVAGGLSSLHGAAGRALGRFRR